MKLDSKGQVTIPAELRRAHGFLEGDEVEVIEDGATLRIIHATRSRLAASASSDACADAPAPSRAFLSYRLLTRDSGRYATYFPTLVLIEPGA
ncbi:AbrB/MazE/SpoVT family DNA-binding domain-containing protein [Microbacterium sp. JZ70]